MQKTREADLLGQLLLYSEILKSIDEDFPEHDD